MKKMSKRYSLTLQEISLITIHKTFQGAAFLILWNYLEKTFDDTIYIRLFLMWRPLNVLQILCVFWDINVSD